MGQAMTPRTVAVVQNEATHAPLLRPTRCRYSLPPWGVRACPPSQHEAHALASLPATHGHRGCPPTSCTASPCHSLSRWWCWTCLLIVENQGRTVPRHLRSHPTPLAPAPRRQPRREAGHHWWLRQAAPHSAMQPARHVDVPPGVAWARPGGIRWASHPSMTTRVAAWSCAAVAADAACGRQWRLRQPRRAAWSRPLALTLLLVLLPLLGKVMHVGCQLLVTAHRRWRAS